MDKRITPHLPVSSRVLGWEEICISNDGTHGHTHQFNQSGQSRSRSWPITECPIARTWESAQKRMSSHGDLRGQIADFRGSFERINWLYLLFKCGIKTKAHFEWLLWHWSSLGQLNLKPTRPLQSANWPREDQCHAHGFFMIEVAFTLYTVESGA